MKKENNQLKFNEWYYQYTKEEFLNLIKEYPFVVFFVDGQESYMISGNRYRWNSNLEVLEEMYYLNGKLEKGWRGSTIESTVDIEEGFLIDFIVRTYED